MRTNESTNFFRLIFFLMATMPLKTCKRQENQLRIKKFFRVRCMCVLSILELTEKRREQKTTVVYDHTELFYSTKISIKLISIQLTIHFVHNSIDCKVQDVKNRSQKSKEQSKDIAINGTIFNCIETETMSTTVTQKKKL